MYLERNNNNNNRASTAPGGLNWRWNRFCSYLTSGVAQPTPSKTQALDPAGTGLLVHSSSLSPLQSLRELCIGFLIKEMPKLSSDLRKTKASLLTSSRANRFKEILKLMRKKKRVLKACLGFVRFLAIAQIFCPGEASCAQSFYSPTCPIRPLMAKEAKEGKEEE